MYKRQDLSHMAGLAVGVMKGEQVFTEAAGFRNTEAADRLSENAVFHCASISKTFTSTAVSYTHLDVYKRQQYISIFQCSWRYFNK